MIVILTWFFSVLEEFGNLIVFGGVGYIIKLLKQIKADNEAERESHKILIRYQIYRTHRWAINLGHIDYMEINFVNDLYKQYTKLGGNGNTKKQVQELNSLPNNLPEN